MVNNRNNPEVLRIYIFYLMARENDLETVLEKFDDLIQSLKQNEGKNADLFYSMSKLFARYCGRRPEILHKTRQMLETCIMLQPENVDFHCEIGHQQTMLADYNSAYATFQACSSFDETNHSPLYGMIFCRVKQDQFDDAAQQLEFLAEMAESENMSKTSQHHFLEALIEWRLSGNKNEAIKLLDQALNGHIQMTKTATSNIDFYIKLNADFLMQLAQEYLVHCGTKPKVSSAGPPKHLIKAIKLLENVTKQNAALIEARVLLGKARWL